MGGDKGSAAAGTNHYTAFVTHGGGTAACEVVVTCHKIFIGNIQRRSDYPTDIYLSRRTEKYAVGVDEKNLTVGMQRTLNNRRIGTEHSVEGNATRRGLCKVNRIALVDGELLPVGRHAVAGLSNRQSIAGLADTATTGNHLPAAGKTGGMCRTHYKQAGGNHCTA